MTIDSDDGYIFHYKCDSSIQSFIDKFSQNTLRSTRSMGWFAIIIWLFKINNKNHYS